MTVTTHKTTVRRAKDDPYRRWAPSCTCGWTGRPTVNKRIATEDAELHARPGKGGSR